MDTLCRTCTKTINQESLSVSVFDDTQIGIGETIAELLLKSCSIEIAPDDQLPKQICTLCLDELLGAISFRRKCELSDQSLHSMLEEQESTLLYLDSTETKEEKVTPEELDIAEETSQSILPDHEEPLEPTEDNNDVLLQCYNVIEMMSFRCCLCSGILYSQEDHREHIELVHEVVFPEDTTHTDEQLICFICQQSFACAEEMETHQGRNFMELFQCNNCEDIYETIDNVSQHFQQTHVLKLEEVVNEPDPPAKKSVKKVQNRKVKSEGTRAERYCCVTHCHEVFSFEKQLVEHAQEKHDLKLKYNKERTDPGKPFVCNVCFRSFASMKNLKVHQFVRANHEQGKHFCCSHCSFRAVSRNLLTIHDRSKHSGERPFECEHCDKRFFSELHLKNHMVCHSSDRPFTCTFCDRGFSRKRNMEEHIRSCHSEEKPFQCELCPARFKVSQHLRIHARIHSGERPYRCSYCDNSYYHISDRKRHEMMHTGEKPYKCDSCGAAFTRKRTLKIHERTHSGERPFCCPTCGKAFCQNATLKKHMERHVREEDTFLNADILDNGTLLEICE